MDTYNYNPFKDYNAYVVNRLSSVGFINSYYQIKETIELEPKRVLVIGVGDNLVPLFLKSLGFEVVTLDVDELLKPDYIASVCDMSLFGDKEFDVVICSHVLEHLPYKFFSKALQEISRISHAAVVFLPIATVTFCLKLRLPFTKERSTVLSVQSNRMPSPIRWLWRKLKKSRPPGIKVCKERLQNINVILTENQEKLLRDYYIHGSKVAWDNVVGDIKTSNDVDISAIQEIISISKNSDSIEHYWEIGLKGYDLSKVRADIERYFQIKKEYHNLDWLYSYNFILYSKSG